MLKFGSLIILAVFLTVAVPIPGYSQKTPINPAAAHGQEAETSQRGTEASPFAVKLMNTGQSDAQAAENKQRANAKVMFERDATNKTINLTLGLVIVGILQAFAILYTALVTNKAANAAKTAADAAITGQRPWIKIDIEHTSSLIDDGNGVRLEFNAIVENVGATPATNVEAYIGMACGPNASGTFAPAYSKVRSANFGGSVSLFPKDPWRPVLFGRITSDEIEAITPESLGKSSLIQAHVTVVAFVKYTFSGKDGQTVKTYALYGDKMNALLRVIDFSKVPIAKDDMTLERQPVFDVVS
jgi:hypothetical protein